MTATEEITIRVDPATAKAYREATPDDRRKYDLLLRLQLRQTIGGPRRGVIAAMDALSAEAEANGMTEEILADILKEWDDERRA